MTNDQLLEVIQLKKDSGYNYRERRHPEWTENYSLYRDRVQTNRLIQRQSVNIPLMKYALNTLRKDIDDAPMLYFHNLDNDAQKEVYYNESFKYYMKETKAVIKDIHDKNNAMLFGRTFKQLNITDGKFDFDVIDPQDINIDRYVSPAKLDTARHLIHEHIYKPLSWVDEHEDWDKKEIKKMKEFFASEDGLLESSENVQDMLEKNERMEQVGLIDVNDPVLGETYVEFNLCYVYDEPDEKYAIDEEEVLHLVVMAQDEYILYKAPLCEVLGHTEDDYWYTHFPYTSWGIDPDATDFWCDGIADVLRMVNKIANSWFSQEVEQRTLAMFGMNYYNSSDKSFVPQTFQPIPGGFYPVPGDPNKVLKSVFPQALQSNISGIEFLLQIAEKASAATTTQQGVTENNVTLGEIKFAMANAESRIKSLAVFYNDSWEEFGHKYTKLIEGAMDLLDDVRIVKKGRNSEKKYSKIISPKEWQTASGYMVEIKTYTDKQQEDLQSIQKLQASRQFFVNNQKFDEILKKKAAEFAGLNAEEVQQVLEEERQNAKALIEAAKAAQLASGANGMGTGGAPTNPALPPPTQTPAVVQ
jgi:hypothetical protein